MDKREEAALLEALHEALPYIGDLVGKTIVVKLGGSALGSHDTTLEDVVTLSRLNITSVLVHGGGSAISGWLKRIGKQPQFVNGLRVTDEETLEVATMVLAGKVNKDLVGGLMTYGGKAAGISGLDGGLLRARQKNKELGLVGEITAVDLGLLQSLVSAGYIPVVAPIGVDSAGRALNINADTAAAEIAVALQAEKLIFLTDVEGILGTDGELITELSADRARDLISWGVISGGMVPKAEACLRALAGVKRSHIIDGRAPHALLRELLTRSGVGTMIIK